MHWPAGRLEEIMNGENGSLNGVQDHRSGVRRGVVRKGDRSVVRKRAGMMGRVAWSGCAR